jgi:GNAT superfamily N-acetyltransferase
MLLRRAEPQDAMSVARVHVRSWQAAYRTLLPDEYLDQLRAEDRASKYDFATRDHKKPQTIVAVDEGLIRGFASTCATTVEHQGELCALYVDPEYWGRGIGAALISDARAQLIDVGCRSTILWILAGNTRADRFYRKDGWEPNGERRTDQVWGITVDEVCYQRVLTPLYC